MNKQTFLGPYELIGSDWYTKTEDKLSMEGTVRMIEGNLYYNVYIKVEDYQPYMGGPTKRELWKRVNK